MEMSTSRAGKQHSILNPPVSEGVDMNIMLNLNYNHANLISNQINS